MAAADRRTGSPSILLADDAAGIRGTLREIAESAGFWVVGEASTGPDTVTLCASLRPDLLALDLVMPGKGVVECIQDIQAALPSVRVVVCSAVGQEGLVLDALEAGARDYILKPYVREKAAAALKKALDG